ncbi:MAG: PQQ-binding-like beta-propeller repeat protein, partial [Pirellulaceae bacterium]|nr:PQQ-binding-like beta-propeller repeat protein [Pirellulaceae bacterium]
FFPDAGLVSFDKSGTPRWSNVLGPFRSMHGLSSSLELIDGKLVLLVDQLDKSHLEVFDAATGKSVWRVDRINGLTGGYSTPAIWRPTKGAAQVIVAGPLELAGYEVTSGKKVWWVNGLTNAPVGVPVVQGDIVYLNEPVGEPIPFTMVAGNDKNKDGKIGADELTDGGFAAFMQNIDRDWGNKDGAVEESEWRKSFDQFNGKGGLAAVKLGGTGDLTKSHILWKYAKSGTYVPSLLTYQNVVYLIRDGGILSAIDAEKGTLLKQGRLEGAIDKYYASPVAGDGKVYFLSESGKLTVIKAGAQWEKLASADLAETGSATPAIAGGRVYVRTAKALYCFGAKA